MAVYYSFHYDRDAWRVQQIVNMGLVEGQTILNAQDWETVKRQGDAAIEAWIDNQMKYKHAVVVLIGRQTSDRPWVRYEIIKAWNDERPLVGIRINGLKDSSGHIDGAGVNPFDAITLKDGRPLSTWVPTYTPTGSDSQAIYASIRANLTRWVDTACRMA